MPEQVRKKFIKFVTFVERATQHRSGIVQEYLHRNEDGMRIEYFHVGSNEFNEAEECWKHGKHKILSNYYPNFQSLRNMISQYYRTEIQFGYQKYLLMSTN